MNVNSQDQVLEVPAIPLTALQEGAALFSMGQIGAALLLSGPFGGTWMAWQNLKRLGMEAQAKKMLGAGVLASLVTLGLVFGTPEGTRTTPIACSIAAGLIALARMFMGPQVESIHGGGGRKESWKKTWGLIGMTWAGLLVLMALWTLIVE